MYRRLARLTTLALTAGSLTAGSLTAGSLTTGAPASAAPPGAGAWTAAPIGFAAVPGDGIATTTGGAGGRTVVVSTVDDLRTEAAAPDPVVILVRGSPTGQPFAT